MKLSKERVKSLLGNIPFTAEVDWLLRRRDKPVGAFHLSDLEAHLSDWAAAAEQTDLQVESPRKVFIFSTLHYWIQHSTAVGVVLAALGHDVTFSYLPYASWFKSVDDYELRQRNLYARRVLKKAEPLLKIKPLLDMEPAPNFPAELEEAVQRLSILDCQYTEQLEEVDLNGELYKMRIVRNTFAASAAYRLLAEEMPDVVLLPNGLVLEFGAVFQAARHLNIAVVSHEYGEQQGRSWLSYNQPVIMQDTDEMWQGAQNLSFEEDQYQEINQLYSARRGGSQWNNFRRQWQGAATEGEEQVRQKLGLDARPVVLMAVNVIGDSLTLGRSLFSGSMTAWIERTLDYFKEHNQAQLVLRIHPGELMLEGPSVAELVARLIPQLPENIYVVAADAPINTYDLISTASLGLVYTTTVGMEMAMHSVPVIVVGKTHYRGKGFTLDPSSWDDYFEILDKVLGNPDQYTPSEEQVRLAWHYAYRFFFDYPQPFPWHIQQFSEDIEEWSMARTLSPEGQALFGQTFAYMAGEPVDWAAKD